MLTFKSRKLGLKRYEIWFDASPAQTLEAAAREGVDFVNFREARHPWDTCCEFRNAVINLNVDEDTIFDTFDKKFRYEVRRAEREGHTTAFINDTEWEPLEEAFQDYVAFSKRKNLPIIPRETIQAYSAAGALTLATALCCGKPLQYHIYLSDSEEAILLGSFVGREGATVEDKVTGWANRMLHWQAMRWFRRHSLLRYNLGGIGNSGSRNNENIIRFKLEMAPRIDTYYYGIVPATKRARLAQHLRRFIRGS